MRGVLQSAVRNQETLNHDFRCTNSLTIHYTQDNSVNQRMFMEAVQLCLLLNKQHLLRLTQHRLNVIQFSYVYAICCDLQIGHLLACQH